jgi:DNA-binding LacI/PurR family transcriptional regulator
MSKSSTDTPITSIYDVAAESGVSITTVSHVYSGKRHVAPETIARVLKTAKKLNYSPRLSAKALATGRSMILGVCFPAESHLLDHNPYFPALLEGLSAAAAKAGYGFLHIPTVLKQKSSHAGLLGQLDGVIVADPLVDDPRLMSFLERDLPIITVGRCMGWDDLPWIDNDHKKGIVDVFSHLDAQGYERPLLFSKEPMSSYEFDVEQAYCSETAKRGYACEILRCRELFHQKTYQAARDFLAAKNRPDVVVTTTDSLAVSVLQAASELGIAIPRDLGVVGEGDTVLASSSIPTLTSIRVFPEQLGDIAVRLLLDAPSGRPTAQETTVPVELVVRASTRRRNGANN